MDAVFFECSAEGKEGGFKYVTYVLRTSSLVRGAGYLVVRQLPRGQSNWRDNTAYGHGAYEFMGDSISSCCFEYLR